jgi:glutathione S-transferase
MNLYGTLTSPYVRKVRAFIHEKGAPCKLIIEAPADAAGNVPRLNPLGKIPLLERDDGEVVFDSTMIIEYVDGLAEPRLIPSAADERWRAQRWHALGHGICEAVVTRLLETRRPPEKQDAGLIARQEGKVRSALKFAEAHLGSPASSGMPLVGGRFGIADIALAIGLEHIDLRYAHDWRAQHPALARWLAGVTERPCLQETRAPA